MRSREAGCRQVPSIGDQARQGGAHTGMKAHGIAAGLIAVHYYLEALVRRGGWESMDMEIWFKRPMFWDERLILQDKTDGGRLSAMRIENQAGKTASQARLNGFSPTAP